MLEFQNVTIYEKKNKILDNFHLKVEDGSIVNLIGTDQSAKEAILRTAAGCQEPYHGRILLNDVSIYDTSDTYFRVGYQSKSDRFYDQLTVNEFYKLFLSIYKVNGRYQERRLEEVYDLLEIGQYRNCFFMEIPAEVKPFLCLGRAILHKPSWLLIDNIFGNMNISNRKKMLDILGMLWEQGTTLLMNTQIFPELMSFITDIAVVEEGKLVSYGTLDSVYKEALRESPIRFHVLSGMEQALKILRENDLVERVTVDKEEVILLFSGGDQEEAQLLTQLVQAGVSIHNFVRDPMNLNEIIWR